jgi:hypothetical protein
MKPPKAKAIALLSQQLAPIPDLKSESRKASGFVKWKELTQTILANLFGQESPQLKNFLAVNYAPRVTTSEMLESDYQQYHVQGLKTAEAQLEAAVAEVTTFWHDEAVTAAIDPTEHIGAIFERFHMVARQLRERHGTRPTLTISDEYDVQDLLHSLLRLFFDDVRVEEWTPSYAGGSSRMDFLLNECDSVIEVKKTRSSMTVKDLGDQLLVDVMRYKAHPRMKCLFCFVYDPDGLLPNPRGIERDLSRTSDGVKVKCVIRPK